MKSYFKQFDSIKKDLKHIQKTLNQQLSEKAEKDLIKAHDMIIYQFYAGHKPTSYHRHGIGGLYNSIVEHKNLGTKAYILVGAQDMEEHYRTSASNVFNLMWNEGVRGLPLKGSKPLDHSYQWLGKTYDKGEVWENPYWSGELSPYHNIFAPSLVFGNYKTQHRFPTDIMEEFVNNWDKAYGVEHCEKIVKTL